MSFKSKVTIGVSAFHKPGFSVTQLHYENKNSAGLGKIEPFIVLLYLNNRSKCRLYTTPGADGTTY